MNLIQNLYGDRSVCRHDYILYLSKIILKQVYTILIFGFDFCLFSKLDCLSEVAF